MGFHPCYIALVWMCSALTAMGKKILSETVLEP